MTQGFTPNASKVINIFARQVARRLMNDEVLPEHFLLGILQLSETSAQNVALKVLSNFGIDLDELRVRVEESVKTKGGTLIRQNLPLSERARKVMDLSRSESRKLGHNYVGTEHLLLGILAEGGGPASLILESFGLTLELARKEVAKIINGEDAVDFPPHLFHKRGRKTAYKQPQKTPFLDQFSIDLTKMARKGELDPIVGRDREINRVIQILARRKKNNPVLIGDPGVGKTAIVEGLAQKIVNGDVPDVLFNKRIIVLNMASVVAGTKYRGEFEERMKRIVKELTESKDIIVFIDEIHSLIGAGGAEGALDASNILKPELARGKIRVIGATTLDEYRKYLEKDRALERRFQPVLIEEPSVEQTIEILKAVKSSYEEHHQVKYDDKAIELAAKLAKRYITDRHLPDKAIDVIDEAGAFVRIRESQNKPESLVKLEKQIENLMVEKEKLVERQEYEKAAKIRDRLNILNERYKEAHDEWINQTTKQKPVVTTDDIRKVVSRMTGIPLEKVGTMEGKKLTNIEKHLSKRVIGQEEAIKALSRAVKRARMGLKSLRKPFGSFVFLGPTGVGKTELAKALAEFLFGSEDALLRLDMSEFMERFSVSRLIGAPPGYVGYQEGGVLTEWVRRRPYSVILFDEIEKADPDIYNILLQILDDGRLTDNLGHTVDFRNTIIIMTSNLGLSDFMVKGSLGFSPITGDFDFEKFKKHSLGEIKKLFPPELMNRIDEFIVFKPLTKENLHKIVDKMIDEVNEELKDKGYKLILSDDAKDFLIERGYDEKNGARPLRRVIQKYIEDNLADLFLSGKMKIYHDRKRAVKVFVEVKGDNLAFKSGEKKRPLTSKN